MKPATVPAIRCAIYTRKSSEEGLDQAFNSLHAQREACEAYVRSQAHEGWRPSPVAYDDGGLSGGNMARPALQRLLADVDAGLVDTIVLYKIDRLTRSLADFARIVERLESRGASFVSVTQAFNTTTSMGRLTLNVLLSFAQFEREVTGERIRDKIAASKAKGMWMGGQLPLGYDAPTDPTTRALVPNPSDAETVRRIFQAYLEVGSVAALQAKLEAEGVRSKLRRSKAGRERGGIALDRGALAHMLANRTYLGEIPHRRSSYPGAHPPIVDEALFEAVQALTAANSHTRKARPQRSAAMALKGLLFGADGEPMSPAFAYGRGGRVYRYYVSAPLQQGRRTKSAENMLRRISAPALEEVLRRELAKRLACEPDGPLSQLLRGVRRVELDRDGLRLSMVLKAVPRALRSQLAPIDGEPTLGELSLPIRCKVRGGRSWVSTPTSAPTVRRDPVLIRGLRQGHALAAALGWKMVGGDLARLDATSPASGYQRGLCRLAFLAPDIQEAILQGRQPESLNLDRLVHGDIPICWSAQRALLAGD